MYGQIDNLIETGDVVTVGGRFIVSGENWEVSLWGKNLLDDDTVVDVFRGVDNSNITQAQYNSPQFGAISPRGFTLTLPRPREIGISATFRF
jgi:hypothetical protein